MDTQAPVVVGGQQIGAGWTPALSVVKALALLAEAKRRNVEAVYWLADEDHDRVEVASVVGFQRDRLLRHRFSFEAPEGTAAGWLPWTEAHQLEAEAFWGSFPRSDSHSFRDHALVLGKPLWRRGLKPFSPTDPKLRDPIQAELERWRAMNLEAMILTQAERIEKRGEPLILDPRKQSAWFSLDPASGLRRALAPGETLPKGCWLSPGAVIRPLMQSLMLPVCAVVLGSAEQAYWRLADPLWEAVGLQAPSIVPRPTVFVVAGGLNFSESQLQALRDGRWDQFLGEQPLLPSQALSTVIARVEWGIPILNRFRHEMARARQRISRLDRRMVRDCVAQQIGRDPEKLRQELFPFSMPMERVLPGLFWLRNENLLSRMQEAMDGSSMTLLLEEL